MKVLHERVAGIDVHKDMIKVAIRSPGEKPWTRKTEVFEFRTFYGVLQEMARELRRRGVTHVAMEASGVYTEPVYHALCEQDFAEVIVVNPAHVKAIRGHKTDARDCARLAELLECGLLHGSFIPSAEQKQVRDLTRYRMKVVQARTSEIQRLHKALESAGIKLGSVLTDITGVSGRLMIDALIDGERRAQVLADLARGTLRSAGKQADLSMALAARFTDHHAMLCRLHRDQIKLHDHAIGGLDGQIADRAGRWPRELGLLKTVPGFGDVVSAAWLAEIGPEPHRWFPSHDKLASWVTLCPGNNISARKRKSGRTGTGHLHQAGAGPGGLGRDPGPRRCQARYRRLVRRFGGRQEPGREKEGDHRDRAYPAQDRLPGPQDRAGLHRAGRGLLHPPGIPQQQHAYLERRLQKLHPGCTVTVTISPPPDSHPPGTAPEAA